MRATAVTFKKKHTVGGKKIRLYNNHADYTIIMSRTLKVTGNHVMYDRDA